MNHNKTTDIWRGLVSDGTSISTSEELKTLAIEQGKDPIDSIRYLQREGYLKRIFRGVFYVVSANERATGKANYTWYEMVAAGLEIRKAAPWYFGLESALKLNGMTHEFFNIDQVISGTLKTTKVIKVQGAPLRILKWSKDLFVPGSILSRSTRHDVNILYSNKEKTILDLAYRRFLDGGSERYVQGIVLSYRDQLRTDLMLDYMRSYPERFMTVLEDAYG